MAPGVLVFLGVGTALALAMHLWRGRNIQQLILFWLVSILGLGLGVAGLLGVGLIMLGGVPVIEASAGALLLLALAARWVA